MAAGEEEKVFCVIQRELVFRMLEKCKFPKGAVGRGWRSGGLRWWVVCGGC